MQCTHTSPTTVAFRPPAADAVAATGPSIGSWSSLQARTKALMMDVEFLPLKDFAPKGTLSVDSRSTSRCPAHTAVVIDGNALHANSVHFPRVTSETEAPVRRFIASQAPYKDEIPVFWRGIVEKRCGAIIDLTTHQDHQSHRIPAYYPQDDETATTFVQKGDSIGPCVQGCGLEGPTHYHVIGTRWASGSGSEDEGIYETATAVKVNATVQVQLIGTRSLQDSRWTSTTPATIATYAVKVFGNGGQLLSEDRVQRWHYNTWTDMESPALVEEFAEMVNTIDQEFSRLDTLVHCVAGIGRTGTLITGLILKQQIVEGKIQAGNLASSLEEIILDLRIQRGSDFVATISQFNFLIEYGEMLLAQGLDVQQI